jgi:hypothetical protein
MVCNYSCDAQPQELEQYGDIDGLGVSYRTGNLAEDKQIIIENYPKIGLDRICYYSLLGPNYPFGVLSGNI